MPKKQNKVEAGLLTKGFRKSGGNHNYFHYYTLDGKKSIIHTKTSHGRNEISDYLLARMCIQCGLKKNEFEELIDCPLSREDYEQKLMEKGLLNRP